MLINSIKKEFSKAKRRGWKKLYLFCDLHETILIPNWNSKELVHEYYAGAKELLQELTARPDICLILYTCSHPHEIKKYCENFTRDGIHFEYINKNPEVQTLGGDYGYYEDKPYFNILFDDKAGFDPAEIPEIRQEFKKHSLTNTETSSREAGRARPRGDNE